MRQCTIVINSKWESAHVSVRMCNGRLIDLLRLQHFFFRSVSRQHNDILGRLYGRTNTMITLSILGRIFSSRFPLSFRQREKKTVSIRPIPVICLQMHKNLISSEWEYRTKDCATAARWMRNWMGRNICCRWQHMCEMGDDAFKRMVEMKTARRNIVYARPWIIFTLKSALIPNARYWKFYYLVGVVHKTLVDRELHTNCIR